MANNTCEDPPCDNTPFNEDDDYAIFSKNITIKPDNIQVNTAVKKVKRLIFGLILKKTEEK